MTASTTTPPPAPAAARARRKDALVSRITVKIPLDPSNSDSYAAAVKAIDALKAGLPAGSTFEAQSSLGKI